MREPCGEDQGEGGGKSGEAHGHTWALMEDYEEGKQEGVSPEERAQQSTRKPMMEQQGS